MNRGARPEPTPPECALAAEMFDHFCSAGTMKQILALHREICNTLTLRPSRLPDFYPKLKAKLASSWKAQALFKKFDARASHKVYGKGRMCPATKVLIIGAGPCGLRAAIECQLVGAKVVVIEKRDRMSRNNVLHLWPFVIQDLRSLGAKKFFGKFCAGSIDHICIRQLQCILLKVALLLGVEFHEGVSFEELLEPTVTENSEGWRARVSPMDHPVSQYEFDALIGADGKRNTLRGFKRKEFRGKLAMAITANFINRHTEQEAAVPEISGVAFIFNQKFFKDLYEMTGIDLENIVYYKDDTHYFVMTAKKHSLLEKGVLLNDYGEVSRLLSVENVDRSALMRYAQEAARFSTDGRLPLRDFALNHYGEPDVALFDFTSMYAAENASMVYERYGRRLLCQLVGDSLLEPFWPTGSGCARGFLSALDAVWAIRAWGETPAPHPLEVIAERESIYRLLAQTTPENIHRDFGAYTLDPGTRYPNLNRNAVSTHRVTSFYDSDDPLPLDPSSSVRKRRRVDAEVSDEALVAWVGCPESGLRDAAGPGALAALLRRYRPDLLPADSPPPPIYHVLHHEFGIAPFSPTDSLRDVPDSKLRSYLARIYNAFKGEVPHIHHETDVFNQIKQSQLREKHIRNTSEHPVSVYTNSVDAEKSHSSCRKKRRSVRNSQVSTDSAENIRKEIEKLDLNKIAQLRECFEGRDTLTDAEIHADRQKKLQEQILSLLETDESCDPELVRQSFAQLFQGSSLPQLSQNHSGLVQFFRSSKDKPTKPRSRLKGLDASSVRALPDLDLYNDSTDTDATVVNTEAALPRTPSIESRKLRSSDRQEVHTDSSKAIVNHSGSNGCQKKPVHTKRIEQIFEHNKKRHSIDPPASRSKTRPSINPEMEQRLERMTEMIEGKRRYSTGSHRKEMDRSDVPSRRPKVADIIQGLKPWKAYCEGKSVGRRKAAREIMRQRYERSLQMLAAEPKLDFVPSADLENDYGLQQYRANAPNFVERVKKLEKQLQHYEEGRIVGGGTRAAGGGARVARLAAELSGSGAQAAPRAPSKPKDLMRSVGKIERDDWNMKEIERKIQENRLGRPEPRTAEKVPKWDREQFLGRQRRLKEGDGTEKWVEIDETLQKLDQKLRDSGRPDHGTKKVANLATKFVKKNEPEPQKQRGKEESKRSWRGPSSAGMQCAACGTRVFAAEGVTADGLHLHRACFRCAVCKTVLRPGNYTMERYGSRLVCLRHSGTSVPDAISTVTTLTPIQQTRGQALTPTPERISLELSDSGAREIDEDEWTDRNFLASETSGAGGLSDEEESSSDEYTDADDSENEVENSPEPQGLAQSRPPRSDLYFSDDSFGYDDYSDDGADSSGNESCSLMRAAREARRREVPADNRLPTDSSEVESEEESESSDEEVSSATEVSTDSEFAREEGLPAQAPPAILVTEPVPPAPTLQPEYPLTRTRSAGGLATKRALELKRKYLLGEPSPPTVRKSDSTSQMDTKFEAFRTNISEFQKLLNPAPIAPSTQKPVVTFQVSEDLKKPMPDIIKNLCEDAPVDLLTNGDSPLCKDWKLDNTKEDVKDVESDSLSDDSSRTETAGNQTVPRVEVHDEGGELVQLDSLTIVTSSIEDSEIAIRKLLGSDPTVIAVDSSVSSESCHDATTMALTETELSDWAVESVGLDECGFDEKEERKRSKNPRQLSGPKLIHNAKDVPALASHVCGRTSPTEPVKYSNAVEHFEFADEGEQDPAIDRPVLPKNLGYMELVDDEYDYSPSNDRSMNFIERSYSETVLKPASQDTSIRKEELISEITTASEADTASAKSSNDKKSNDNSNIVSNMDELRISDISPPLEQQDKVEYIDLISPPAVDKMTKSILLEDGDKEECTTLTCPPSILKTTKPIAMSSASAPLEMGKKPCMYATPPLAHITKSNSISRSSLSPPLEIENVERIDSTTHSLVNSNMEKSTPKSFNGTISLRLYSPAICRSASETFHRPSSDDVNTPTRSSNSSTRDLSSWSTSPASPMLAPDTTVKVQELKREREEQTELVKRLVLERLGNAPRVSKKSIRRARVSPVGMAPPPVPPPPVMSTPTLVVEDTPPRPAPPLQVQVTPSFSDPELTADRRRKGIMRSITSYLNRRLGPRQKDLQKTPNMHKSTGALQEAPPVPPPPVHYTPPRESRQKPPRPPGPDECDADERDAMQLWFEARWARLLAQRRARDQAASEEAARRVSRLERRLSRPLSDGYAKTEKNNKEKISRGYIGQFTHTSKTSLSPSWS